MFSVPSSRNNSATWLRKFTSTDATTTTVTMPITTPRIASSERAGWARNAANAIWRVSSNC